MSDVIVIGAGPGGSMAARMLARRGVSVRLLEQSRFPRHKVCGECLSDLGASVLQRQGLIDRLPDSGAVRLRRVGLHAAGGRSLWLDLPNPMWGVSRHCLDQMLLKAATEAGVAVVQPARAERIEADRRPRVVARDLMSNQIASLEADWVIVADGKAAIATDKPPATTDFGIKAHFADVSGPRDAVELFGCRGVYGGLAAIEAERWNASFSVPASRLAACGGKLATLFDELIDENPTLRQRLVKARMVGDPLAAPLPRYRPRQSPRQRILFVGNGAAALEPIGGEGMGLALRSAELTSQWLLQRLSGQETRSPCVPQSHLWTLRQPACRAAALLARNPLAATLSLQLLQLPMLRDAMLFLCGKGAGAAG